MPAEQTTSPKPTTPTHTPNTFLIIDASGLLYRSFYAVRSLSSPSGEPTGALYGFIRSITKAITTFSPTHLVSVFDGRDNKRSRLAIYADYKAHRKPTPPELIHQIGEAKRFCELANIPSIDIEGVEADDAIASLALNMRHRFQGESGEEKATVLILSADKDLMQLVQDNIFIVNPMKDSLVIDHDTVVSEWELEPKQIRDYLAIVGDSSDNVPGISGLGPKAAKKLIADWSSLENIYRNLDSIHGKVREKLEAGRESAFLSLKLITLDSNLPIPYDTKFFEKRAGLLAGSHSDELIEFYVSKGFKSLLKPELSNLIASHPSKHAPSQELSLFPLDTAQDSPDLSPCDVKIVDTKESLTSFLKWLSQKPWVAIDCETTSLNEHTAEIVGLGIGHDICTAYYIDFARAPFSPEYAIGAISDVLSAHKIPIVGHNSKYDLHVLVRYGLQLPNIEFDTLIASWVLAAHEKTHSLDALSLRHFGKRKTPIEELIGKASRSKPQGSMRDVPQEIISKYCAEDIEYTIRLKTLFEDLLHKEPALNSLFRTIEMPLVPILFAMEREGIFINVETLSSLKSIVESSLATSRNQIYALAGEEFNINSTKQLANILYGKLGIPPVKKGKTAFSTDAEVLEELSCDWPIAAAILEYRQLEKLRSTYIDALPQAINPVTNRVHCRFIQSGTATGRLACQDPNLQNIPIRSELGKSIRSAFQPQQEGWSFVSCDYSQIELRILAHMSEDPTLMDAFHRGLDIHAITAKEIFHVPLSEVTQEMRRRAKAVNFGVIYGQRGFGLSKELRIPLKEANDFIEAYFRRYTNVTLTIEQAKEEARRLGYATTLTGRRRMLPDIQSSNHAIRSMQERLAVNTPFQGTAADIIKMAMIGVARALQEHRFRAKMLLQIHDELLFEVPDDEIDRLIPIVRHEMEQVMALKVPLKVDIAIGKNWKEC